MRTTTLHRIVQRLALLPLLVALFALAGAWLVSGTASAAPRVIVLEPTIGPEAPGPQPQGPTTPTEPTKPTEPTEPTSPPQSSLVIKAQADCERTPGFRYEIIPVNQPYELTDYNALWGPVGGGLNVHAGQSGFVASGEGQFTVSGHAVFGEKKFDSAKVDVTVKCDDEPRKPKPDPDPDKPRPGKPNFTG